ncbi:MULTISPECIES: Imm7 family immunity protein [unclassified Bartonella]|uniref:Imm7 family immunity protein n=1 Tax=unclassified Bartonella TaxID=2645622 RepID=UPI0015FE6BFF|nr:MULTISPECIES: Imm7 family immunity protein [unclassified Bartonella]UXN05026.1 immunity 7 family protein [Bartonella sp. HY406]
MIEYQGWMTVSGHWLEECEEDFDYQAALKTIKAEFKNKFAHENVYHENNCFIKLDFFNGLLRITAIGCNNRKTNIFQNLFDFFTFTQSVAIGSYGIFSFYDDEPSGEYKYHIYKFIKGECIHDFDPLLSSFCSME